LVGAGYTSAGQVRQASDWDLLAIRGLGRLSLAEIRDYFGQIEGHGPPVRALKEAMPTEAEMARLEQRLDTLIAKMERLLALYRRAK
jgi:hypothetical protein